MAKAVSPGRGGGTDLPGHPPRPAGGPGVEPQRSGADEGDWPLGSQGLAGKHPNGPCGGLLGCEGGRELSEKCQIMRAVKGPMGAFLHHAGQIGWDVIGPIRVRDRAGAEIDLREASPQWVTSRARWDAQEVAFEATQATRVHDGAGLEYGADLMPARKAIKNMAVKDPHLAELAGMAVNGGACGHTTG